MAKRKIEVWLDELGTDEEQFCAYTELSFQELSFCANGEHQVVIDGIQSIFEQLEAWFDSPKNAWHWFISQRIVSYGNFTPALVIKQYGRDGVHAVEKYIMSKELGAFE